MSKNDSKHLSNYKWKQYSAGNTKYYRSYRCFTGWNPFKILWGNSIFEGYFISHKTLLIAFNKIAVSIVTQYWLFTIYNVA